MTNTTTQENQNSDNDIQGLFQETTEMPEPRLGGKPKESSKWFTITLKLFQQYANHEDTLEFNKTDLPVSTDTIAQRLRTEINTHETRVAMTKKVEPDNSEVIEFIAYTDSRKTGYEPIRFTDLYKEASKPSRSDNTALLEKLFEQARKSSTGFIKVHIPSTLELTTYKGKDSLYSSLRSKLSKIDDLDLYVRGDHFYIGNES